MIDQAIRAIDEASRAGGYAPEQKAAVEQLKEDELQKVAEHYGITLAQLKKLLGIK